MAPASKTDPAAVRGQLMNLLSGFLHTQTIATVAHLGVADIVGDQPVPVAEIAERVGADPGALHRVLRLLAADGVFSEAEPGAFVATPLSDCLKEDRPDTVRYIALQQGGTAYLCAGHMLECVRSGEPAAETVLGRPLFEHLAHNPEASEIFNRAMAGGAGIRVAVALDRDWSNTSVVADIGGGNGALLIALLGSHPHLRGVVFDLPHVVAAARPKVEEAGLSGRCDVVGGDFFAGALPPADTYVLAQILHDWDDDRAAAILRNCRRSIASDGRLLVLEQVLFDGDEPSYARVIDLIMLTVAGGKERTKPEWEALLRAGGFELKTVTASPAACLLEAGPV